MQHWESEFRVGRRHVSFSGRTSIPTVGAMDDGVAQCYFRVVEGGLIVHRVHNVLEFQWLGLDAHQVKMCAVDRDGNFGDWETYTYSVLPNTSADWVRYISASGNDTTGDGSVGNPWATATKASTEFAAAVGANQVGAVIVDDDDTWAHTATLLNTGDSIRRLLRFVRRGNGSTRPKFTFSNGITAFAVGKRGAVHVEGIDLQGAHTSEVGVAFGLTRSGGVAADQSPWDLMVVDSEVTNFGMVCYCNPSFGGSGPGYTDRDEGCFDFVAFQNCGFEGTRSYHFYGFFNANEVLARNVEFRVQGGGFPSGIVRIWSLGRMYFEGCTTPGVSAGIRLMVNNNDPAGSFRSVTFVDCEHVGIAIGPDPGATGAHYFDEVRLVNCRSGGSTHLNVRADDAGSNGIYVGSLDMINCEAPNGAVVSVGGSGSVSHVYSKIRLRDCISSSGYGGGNMLTLNGTADKYALGCVELRGCAHVWATPNPEPRTMVAAFGMTRADLAARIAYSNYNRIAKEDSDSTDFAWGSNGRVGLATWQSESGHDANSSVTLNSTLNVTNPGFTPALADFHLLSDSGPLSGGGCPFPSGVAIDAEGYLRSATTPDAGPYEYGATDTPADPPLPAPSSASRMRRHGLVLGLRLRP